MDVRNISEIPWQEDLCGRFKTIYETDSMTVSYFIIEGAAKSHKHEIMEEVYIIEKGRGTIHIGEEVRVVGPPDVISIPKGSFHHLEADEKLGPLELWVITHPKYDPSDVIEQQ